MTYTELNSIFKDIEAGNSQDFEEVLRVVLRSFHINERASNSFEDARFDTIIRYIQEYIGELKRQDGEDN